MKIVVVAGSRGLIGKAIVKKLAEQKWLVIENDPKYANSYCDLTKSIDYLFKKHGDVQGFVNCSYPKTFDEHINFFMWCTEQFAERMKGGSIVNLSSIYGIIGPDDSMYDGTDMIMPSWYSACKGAIIAHSRCLAVRHAPNIRINCVSPGGVKDNQHWSFVDRYERKAPMKRMAKPEDIANVVAFLLGDESSYLTGQNIILDGGILSKV